MLQLTNHTNETLIGQLRTGNMLAFKEIYDRYWEKLYDSALKILQDRPAAQDAVQEVFIDIWKRRCDIEIQCVEAYLFQSVRFQVFKAIRREKISARIFKRIGMVSRDLVYNDPSFFNELEEVLQKVMATLPEDEQTIFRMNRNQGLTYKQISLEKKISIKTVEKKMSHALGKIRYGFNDALMLLIILFGLSDAI